MHSESSPISGCSDSKPIDYSTVVKYIENYVAEGVFFTNLKIHGRKKLSGLKVAALKAFKLQTWDSSNVRFRNVDPSNGRPALLVENESIPCGCVPQRLLLEEGSPILPSQRLLFVGFMLKQDDGNNDSPDNVSIHQKITSSYPDLKEVVVNKSMSLLQLKKFILQLFDVPFTIQPSDKMLTTGEDIHHPANLLLNNDKASVGGSTTHGQKVWLKVSKNHIDSFFGNKINGQRMGAPVTNMGAIINVAKTTDVDHSTDKRTENRDLDKDYMQLNSRRHLVQSSVKNVALQRTRVSY